MNSHDPNSTGATGALAAWASQVPPCWTEAAIRIASHAVEDTIASLVAGAGDSGTAIARAAAFRGPVPVIGRLSGGDAASAALVNGYAAHATEMDENFLVGLGHLGCSVLPGLMSVAHEADLGGEAVLDALIVASEVMARVGSAVHRAHTDKGWHGTGTLGAIAAAAGCGRLMGLDPLRMRNALGLAVSMAGGAKIQFGTQTKPLHAGLASQAGVWASRLASFGMQAHEEALEGRLGFGALYAGVQTPDWSSVVPTSHDALAIEFHGLAFKLWPSCAATHRAIASTLAIRNTHQLRQEDVRSVTATVSHGALVNLRYDSPMNHKQAQFSMNYALAVALKRGTLTLADFAPGALQDQVIRGLMPKVAMVRHPQFGEGMEGAARHIPHRVTIDLYDGRRFEHETAHLKGSPGDPLTDTERRQKFEMCCDGQMPAHQLDVIRRALERPAGIESMRAFMNNFSFDAGCDDGQRFVNRPFSGARSNEAHHSGVNQS